MPRTTRRAAALALAAGMTMAIASAEEGIATGPDVGTKIPDITAPDQYGKVRTFESLRGPEGLLLLFHRSADW